MKTVNRLLIASLLLLPLAAGLRADEPKAPATAETVNVLKERQKENKFKLSSQSIYKVTMRSGVVFHIQTAVGYVSTIDLPEKALKVFVGDQDMFKVGVYETQVLIKPLTDEPDARSNLIIVTPSGRLAFDLSVGPPETADLVIDFRLPQDDEALVQNAFDKKVEEKSKELANEFKKKEGELDQKAKELAEEKLKEKVSEKVQNIPLKASATQGGVQVNLLALSQIGDKGYLKFSVLNYSKEPYRISKVMLGGVIRSKNPFKKTVESFADFTTTVSVSRIIGPEIYAEGLVIFDFREMAKKQKPLFRMTEENGDRNIEIINFKWPKPAKS